MTTTATHFRALIAGAALLVAGRGLADTPAIPDFAPYAVILERQPFGSPTAAPAAPKVDPNLAPADSFIKSLRMCAITENPAGIRVGLVDLQSTPNKTHFLYVGESEDGLEVVEADCAAEKALLRKGAEEYWIYMNAGTAIGAGASGATATIASNTGAPGQPPRLTYADRVRRRREMEEQRLKELQARPPISQEELEKTLQKLQMDVIRRGEPALPIPLTPQMDDQLVSEGVLPPTE